MSVGVLGRCEPTIEDIVKRIKKSRVGQTGDRVGMGQKYLIGVVGRAFLGVSE